MGLPMTSRPTRRHIALLAAALAVIAAFVAIEQAVDFSQLLKPERIAEVFRSAGPAGPLLLIAAMTTAVVVSPIPSFPIDLAAGIAYGPLWGTAYAVLGALIGAMLSFVIARALGRELLEKLFRLEIRFCERCSDEHLVLVLVLARLLPIVSFDVISYGAGLTGMSLTTFSLATLVGMIPPTFAFTYFGSSVASAQWTLIAVGGAMVVLFLLTPKLVLRYPNAWWARLFLASAPTPGTGAKPSTCRVVAPGESGRCSGCGLALESHPA
jgi:uncharacterized membrane protein YdjX (TVP38/TMEM64 family)